MAYQKNCCISTGDTIVPEQKKPDPYQNETDNYLQQHFQLFINQKFSAFWKANITGFLTHGKGFYEQYKAGKKLSAYGLPNYFNGADTVYTSDIVRQLWLNNYFYGNIFSAQYEKSQRQIIIGAGWNQYKGKHYGKVTWAKEPVFIPSNFKWYNNNAFKNEFSSFVKWTENFSKNWHLFADLQVKKAVYHINGFRDNPTINLSNRYFYKSQSGHHLQQRKNQNLFFLCPWLQRAQQGWFWSRYKWNAKTRIPARLWTWVRI